MVYGLTHIALPSADWALPKLSSQDSAVSDSAVSDSATLRCYSATPGLPMSSSSGTTEPNIFVVGPENRLATPAIERLLSDPAAYASNESRFFNPLVLLGSTGTGKSHLARGIVRHWYASFRPTRDKKTDRQKDRSGKREPGDRLVGYFTAVDFSRQLRSARDEQKLDDHRRRLANLRLLVIEDLHQIPDRTFVQRELRDTLDHLVETGAAIVITTQQPPAAMANLEAGLRDRLSGGLTVRLQHPSLETRIELVQLIAKQRNLPLSPERCEQIAQRVEGTATQLFRAVTHQCVVSADNPVEGGKPPISAAIAATQPQLKFKQILAVVARYYSLTQAAVCSSQRRKSLVHARAVAIYLARLLTDLSYAQIGQHLGRRDHSTVMHAIRTFKKQLATNADDQRSIEELKRILTSS